MLKKKFFFLILLLIFSIFILPSNVSAKSYDYDKIRVEIDINKDATFDVKEEMVYNLDGDFGYLNRILSLKDLDYISDIEVFADGRKLNKGEYEISNKGGKRVQWNFSRRDFPNEQKSWTLKYKVHGGLGFYKDHDELYWNAIFSDREVLVRKAEVLVTLPENQDMEKVLLKIFSEQDGSEFIKKALSQKQFYFGGSNINPQTNFTIVVAWPKGLFNYKRVFTDYWFAWYRLFGILFPLIVLIIMFIWWYKKGRDPKLDKTIIAEYTPPNDLKPLEVEVLMKNEATLKGIFATLIDLAIRGYLKIYEEKRKWWQMNSLYEFEFLKEWVGDENLKDYEKMILDEMKNSKNDSGKIKKFFKKFISKKEEDDNKNIVSTTDLRLSKFAQKCSKIFELVYERVVREGIFEKNPNKIKKPLLAVGGVLLGLSIAWFVYGEDLLSVYFNINWVICGFLAVGIILLIFGGRMPKRTLKGTEEMYHLLGFKLYLETAERYRLEASTLEYFEKYLPYAMVMGVEKKWARKFENIKDLGNPSWYVAGTGHHLSFVNSSGNFSPVNFSKSMSSMTAAFMTSSSGGGTHGGFAGGGGGGGGGGAG